MESFFKHAPFILCGLIVVLCLIEIVGILYDLIILELELRKRRPQKPPEHVKVYFDVQEAQYFLRVDGRFVKLKRADIKLHLLHPHGQEQKPVVSDLPKSEM